MAVESQRSLGDMLVEVGWKQGSLFEASSLYFQYNELASPNSGSLTAPRAKKEKADKLVLITQTCDIKSKVESRVEALICKLHKGKQDFLANADGNSIRWFLIDPRTELVAYAAYRLQVEKAILQRLTPEPWPGDATRLQRFRDWLARRYDRPALPDKMVDHFQKPLEAVLKRFNEDQPDVGLTFNRAVREIRVRQPDSDNPPFRLRLLLMLHRGTSQDQAEAIDTAIDAVMAELLNTLDSNLVVLDPQPVKATEQLISVADYFATVPLFFNYLTYQGEEIHGAEPLGRA